jgi:hypothetical protein
MGKSPVEADLDLGPVRSIEGGFADKQIARLPRHLRSHPTARFGIHSSCFCVVARIERACPGLWPRSRRMWCRAKQEQAQSQLHWRIRFASTKHRRSSLRLYAATLLWRCAAACSALGRRGAALSDILLRGETSSQWPCVLYGG